MAALTAARDVPPIQQQNVDGGYIIHLEVATDVIYAGAYVVASATGIVAAGGNANVVGLALETIDNSAGATGILCRCQSGGVVRDTLTSAALDDIGKNIYADDDQLLTLTEGTNSHVGVIIQLTNTNEVAILLGARQVITTS